MSSYVCSSKHFNSIEMKINRLFKEEEFFKYNYELKDYEFLLTPEQHTTEEIKHVIFFFASSITLSGSSMYSR